jgi:hypothetical protein
MRPRLIIAPLLIAASIVASAAVAAKEPLTVVMDRAKIMKISAPAATVIVGNPAIADALIHDRQTLIITGRAVGLTNLVILDAKGEPIADEVIVVQKIQDGLVTVQRGGNRSSYSCTPHCANMMEVGDAPAVFDQTVTQLKQRNSFGSDGATAQGPASGNGGGGTP